MTANEAIALADRLLERHLSTALTNYADQLQTRGTDPQILAQKVHDYKVDLEEWKRSSLAVIELKVARCSHSIH